MAYFGSGIQRRLLWACLSVLRWLPDSSIGAISPGSPMPKGPQGERQPYKCVRDLCMGAGFLAGYLIYRLTGHPQLVYTFIPVGGMLVGFGAVSYTHLTLPTI